MKQEFGIKGMHCKSCEILIEEELAKKKGVKKAEVNLGENKLTIESERKIGINELNKWFLKSDYSFIKERPKRETSKWWLGVIVIAGLFVLLGKIGWNQFIDINNQTSWLILFLFGVVAGFSSCGALLSGMIVGFDEGKYKIILGRIISYIIFGGVLGYLGEKVAIGGWMNLLMIIVSLVMTITALQMLGVKWVEKIRLRLNKNWSKKIVNSQLAWVAGLLSVFLPCGFTLLAEGSAIISGSWLEGVKVMLMFAIGSSIPLWLISKGVGRLKNQKAVGLLVLFFVFYNLWFWLVPEVNNLQQRLEKETANQEEVKTIKLSYGNFGLNPYQITIKRGEKIKLEIEATVTEYGCMSTILLPEMFTRPQTLTKGKTIIMEFIPKKTGIYKFICAMGVPHRGEINVVE